MKARIVGFLLVNKVPDTLFKPAKPILEKRLFGLFLFSSDKMPYEYYVKVVSTTYKVINCNKFTANTNEYEWSTSNYFRYDLNPVTIKFS